ncbi:MAG: dihydroorotate dehydrogenase family protein, partial [Deltaproteobacteria bacterium]|nr:dihydroorotate dehydrogenase family protein [Deltaproteobacteria bacterium]
GYGHFQTLLKGLEGYMDMEKLDSLIQIRGRALPHITTIDEVSKRPPMVSQVDPERCTNLKKGGCELCGKVCFYDAVEFSPRLKLKTKNCDGCNLCVEICPVGALSLVPTK